MISSMANKFGQFLGALNLSRTDGDSQSETEETEKSKDQVPEPWNILYDDECGYPSDLFTRENGEPVVFAMRPGAKRVSLRDIVMSNGGILFDAGLKEALAGKHVIHLAEQNQQTDGLPTTRDIFDCQYVLDCLTEGELLPDLQHYRITQVINKEYNPFEVLNGKVGWDSIVMENQEEIQLRNEQDEISTSPRKKTNGESILNHDEVMEQSGFDSDLDLNNAVQRSKKQVDLSPSKKGRMAYTRIDQQNIIDYIRKRRLYSEVKGNSMWKGMEVDKCDGAFKGYHRSWQSLKEQFRKTIRDKIESHQFDSDYPPRVILRFRRAFDGDKGRYTGSEFELTEEDTETNDEMAREPKSPTKKMKKISPKATEKKTRKSFQRIDIYDTSSDEEIEEAVPSTSTGIKNRTQRLQIRLTPVDQRRKMNFSSEEEDDESLDEAGTLPKTKAFTPHPTMANSVVRKMKKRPKPQFKNSKKLFDKQMMEDSPDLDEVERTEINGTADMTALEASPVKKGKTFKVKKISALREEVVTCESPTKSRKVQEETPTKKSSKKRRILIDSSSEDLEDSAPFKVPETRKPTRKASGSDITNQSPQKSEIYSRFFKGKVPESQKCDPSPRRSTSSSVASSSVKNPYKPIEDAKLWKIITTNPGLMDHVKGMAIWNSLASENKIPGRSADSLKNRFMKYLLPNKDKMDDFANKWLASSEEEIDLKFEMTNMKFKTAYTAEEDQDILDFICQNRKHDEVGGNALWELMEFRGVGNNRTHQSLKERFRKRILPRLKNFNISKDDIRRLT